MEEEHQIIQKTENNSKVGSCSTMQELYEEKDDMYEGSLQQYIDNELERYYKEDCIYESFEDSNEPEKVECEINKPKPPKISHKKPRAEIICSLPIINKNKRKARSTKCHQHGHNITQSKHNKNHKKVISKSGRQIKSTKNDEYEYDITRPEHSEDYKHPQYLQKFFKFFEETRDIRSKFTIKYRNKNKISNKNIKLLRRRQDKHIKGSYPKYSYESPVNKKNKPQTSTSLKNNEGSGSTIE